MTCKDCAGPLVKATPTSRPTRCEPCRKVHKTGLGREQMRRYRAGVGAERRAADPERYRELDRASRARGYVRRRQDPAKVEKDRAKNRLYWAEHPTKHAEAHVRRKYGITWGDVLRMLEECGNACMLCDKPFPEWPSARREPHVDHDWVTDRVRGLLCMQCNTTLGRLERLTPEWWARMVAYVGEEPVGRATHVTPTMQQKAVEAMGRVVGE